MKIFVADDWEIKFFLFGGFPTETISRHAIAGGMDDGRNLKPEIEIKAAVEEKADRYGRLDAPYLIVVADCKCELAGGKANGEALMDAM